MRLGGVDDPDGAAEFRLVAPGGRCARPVTATTHAAPSRRRQRVPLTFDVDEAAGGVRVLLVGVATTIARWELADARRRRLMDAALVTRRYRDSAHG